MAFGNTDQERLLRALAEQLKIPLIQIARQAELANDKPDVTTLGSISYTADMALRLIDSYLLSVQLQALPSLELEPVSVSAVLQDTAHSLNKLAKQYDCNLEVHLKGKYQPVMAHYQTLEAAYASLGYAFIESASAAAGQTIVLGAHTSPNGLVAGVYANRPGITADALRRGLALYGTARQGMPTLSSSSSAGVFVAHSLLSTIEAPLHSSRHNKLSGLAATLLPSRQLALV